MEAIHFPFVAHIYTTLYTWIGNFFLNRVGYRLFNWHRNYILALNEKRTEKSVWWSLDQWYGSFEMTELPLISTGICLITGTCTTFSTIFSTGYGICCKRKKMQMKCEFGHTPISREGSRNALLQIPFFRWTLSQGTAAVRAQLSQRFSPQGTVLAHGLISQSIWVHAQSSLRALERSSPQGKVLAPIHTFITQQGNKHSIIDCLI